MKRFLYLVFYLVAVHITALTFTTALRLMHYISCHHLLSPEAAADGGYLPAQAFLHGLWFDNVIGCYILLLPLVAAVAVGLSGYCGRALFACFTGYFALCYGLVFLISVADIPYFEYFFRHLNSSIFEWFGYAQTTAGMLFGESRYLPYILLYVLSTAFFVAVLVRLGKYFRGRCYEARAPFPWHRRLVALLVGLCLVGLCIFGIRGRTGYNPIKVSAAYFCQDAYLNQLGVSPTFNLLTSVMDDMRPENRYLRLMDDEEAVQHACRLLGREGVAGLSPLAMQHTDRRAAAGIGTRRPNVVLIFMESMSARLMKRFGQEQTLTPFLDSLYTRSIGFSRCYSAGIHTNHGLYATLYSFPALMKRNLMKGSVIPQYSGLPTVLKDNGYHNLFFMTHEGQYDNMNAFLRTNGYDEVYAQEDYPADRVVNSFGVPDDFLYDYALSVLNRRAAEQEGAFFATLLSISNHPPYVIPPYFHPTTAVPETQIVEYADWALRRFFAQAQQQPWFANTLFVLVGDHGKLVGEPDCELPQTYNHVPLMLYSPLLAPAERHDLCGQIDLQPTLLGMLGMDYVQNNFGIDLLRERRPCMFYTADNMIAARNDSLLFLYNYEADRTHTYRLEQGKPVATPATDHFLPLQDYAFSMLQAAEYIVKQKKTLNR